MSHHFFNENEILEPEALNPELIDINSRLLDINLDNNFSMNGEFYQPCYSLQPSNQFSPTQHFIYKAELTNAFLEKGTIDIVDQFEAENKAILNDFQSENAFEVDNGFNIDTEAGHRIKNSLLYEIEQFLMDEADKLLNGDKKILDKYFKKHIKNKLLKLEQLKEEN